MRIVFMGTPDFAVPCLDILLKNNYEIVGVVTAPDRAAGRGQLMHSSAIKKYALEKGLKLLQPEKLKDETFIKELKSLNADLQIVVAFRMLPETVWSQPRLGTYNLHGSLLPKYRGAAPINWAIINGEKESGVTTFKLQHEIDTGSILFNEKVKIKETTTAGELHDTLMDVGASLVLKTVKAIEESEIKGTSLNFFKQDDTQASHAPKIFKDTCRINWNKPLEEITNLIRGLSPYPGAYTELLQDNKSMTLKLFNTEKVFENNDGSNGSLITDNKNFMKVKCSNGLLNILELQLEGKKRMSVAEFLRGFNLKQDALLQ